ncbi:pyridoxal-phosphate dependent enzyme [Roseomonas sp. NAR14]|uniref:Pyridoxal-phosphate dependent enzyme n=1 Tax=Roseomonas acroporae TaxID=2937791 RepID=A0A9X2BVA0_9PROT|nr:pyridoxal-phosphate dependent enzyme [Roseomonas acroporae]MCK8786448.1 pyridoxal-phosphate dependent enzyme [Roseomonas acroporae]
MSDTPDAPAYLDPLTGRTWPLDAPRWCAEADADGDRRPLLLTPLPGIGREAIDPAAPGLWRYAAALPFRPAAPITLGEGRTPLVPRRFAGGTMHAKCEWLMPSGSFKDRGAAVMLSLLREQGIVSVLEDSSGNGGAAIATYAAAGGLRARILVPESTSPAKTVQSRAAGAAIALVPGTRQDCADAAEREGEARADGIFYASHNWHPFFLQGTKLLAYELWEDLGFRAPDNVIVPCGAGSNVLGCGIGFSELRRAGQIESLPRIFAAQPANCAPVARAFLDEEPAAAAPTIAEGTAIARPIRLREVLGVLEESQGGAVMLTEAEIAAATLALARDGLYVEPTSAQAAAAFGRLLAAGTIAPEETTVVVLTGSGLKATPRIADLLGVAG